MLTKNPLAAPSPDATRSALSIAGHPLHAMLVNFPISFLLGGFASDVAFWWTGDPFWARASLWLIGAGFGLGAVAAVIGTLDFLSVKEIRRHTAAWTHFLSGVMLVSLGAANWWSRVPDPAGLLPWGLFLSGVTVLSVGAAGWIGGKLVFEHNVGTVTEE